jgi:N-acetylneuraminic acid mutarotase
VVGPIIALIGGDDGSLNGKQDPATHPGFSKGILTYDTQFDAWAESGEAPIGRVTLPCARWNGGFVLVNGETSPACRSKEAWHATA